MSRCWWARDPRFVMRCGRTRRLGDGSRTAAGRAAVPAYDGQYYDPWCDILFTMLIMLCTMVHDRAVVRPKLARFALGSGRAAGVFALLWPPKRIPTFGGHLHVSLIRCALDPSPTEETVISSGLERPIHVFSCQCQLLGMNRKPWRRLAKGPSLLNRTASSEPSPCHRPIAWWPNKAQQALPSDLEFDLCHRSPPKIGGGSKTEVV